MHRIDSVNARPDQNGTGKQGFNDNTDLSGQDATYLDPDWCNAVQEEIATVVEDHQPLAKGTNGQLKAALYAIFATNENLSEAVEALEQAIVDHGNTQFDKQYPIGTGTIFNLDNRNPSVYLGRGVWESFGGGTHLSLAGTSDGVTLVGGAVSGSHTHTITIDEAPAHNHANGIYKHLVANADDALASSETWPTEISVNALNNLALENEIQVAGFSDKPDSLTEIKESGGGQPMPIRPRTTTIYGWLRTG